MSTDGLIDIVQVDCLVLTEELTGFKEGGDPKKPVSFPFSFNVPLHKDFLTKWKFLRST